MDKKFFDTKILKIVKDLGKVILKIVSGVCLSCRSRQNLLSEIVRIWVVVFILIKTNQFSCEFIKKGQIFIGLVSFDPQ